jgi:hypothetical protein
MTTIIGALFYAKSTDNLVAQTPKQVIINIEEYDC